MANQSVANNSMGPTLSQVPPLRSFEFDKSAVGNIQNSVNQFRGSVALPIDLLTLPGREGLDVKITAVYSSVVQRAADTWNLDAPTGILGLGWDLPFAFIAIDKRGGGSDLGSVFYLVNGGSASPMVKTGETQRGEWTFQLRNYQFWDIRYAPSTMTWTIIREDGFVMTYGGLDTGRNAIQWGVKWGDWIGSSNESAGQERYPAAWNLTSLTSPVGQAVVYSYETVEVDVGSSGLAFTQACYLKRVVDSLGRQLSFRYGEKYGARNPSPQGMIEYQAQNAAQPEPNAYQNKYETRYLDGIDVANAAGELLYSLQFTYNFINLSPSNAPQRDLMWKRCLASVFQYSPDGSTLPPLRFSYTDLDSVNPGALDSITYPSGAVASYRYKKSLIFSPKHVEVGNPRHGSVPGVWQGSDYVVFTFCEPSPGTGLSVVVYSWNGQWISYDITAPDMSSVSADPGSLRVMAHDDYIAIALRNLDVARDELYIFERDETRFGNFKLYNDQPFRLRLVGADAGPSSFVSGDDFVVASNRDYDDRRIQGWSYDWRDGVWSPIALLDSASDATSVTLAAFKDFCITGAYFADKHRVEFRIYFRDLEGGWQAAAPWSVSDIDIVASQGQSLWALLAQPNYVVMTSISSASATAVDYTLRVYQWDENFNVLNPGLPAKLDLTSPLDNGHSQYDVFSTSAHGALLTNALGNLRTTSGGFPDNNANWLIKTFAKPSTGATVKFAAGDDVAIMCVDDNGSQRNTLLTFDPNALTWSLSPNISQDGHSATIAGNTMTVGRVIYFRGPDSQWLPLTIGLNNLGDEASVQNRGTYIAYQDGDDSTAASYTIMVRNGDAAAPRRLPGAAQKVAVPSTETAVGVQLAGPRFLVSYPSGTTFSKATSLHLYDLDDTDVGDYAVDYPVAYVRIDDPYTPAQPFVQSYFYADSEQSMIAYNGFTGLAQYPLVSVVPGVASTDDQPPRVQPKGRSDFFYSNGLSPQGDLRYPIGWIYNYANVLNGMLLSRQDYDSNATQVASQLNYWRVSNNDAVAGQRLYGGYARLERTTTVTDGVTQDSLTAFDASTGVQLWQQQSFTDAEGRSRSLRVETLYAWQVPAYESQFRSQHIFTASVQTTRRVSDEDGGTQYISSEVTTYRDWASGSGGNPRLAPHQSYQWTRPGPDAPRFDFATSGNREGWLLQLEVVRRSDPACLIEQQRDVTGVPTSFIYDVNQRGVIAKFPAASHDDGEASYTGFETYESDQGWSFGSLAAVIPNDHDQTIDAHQGLCSVRLAANATGQSGIHRVFTPADRSRSYRFCAWVKTPDGFDPARGEARWLIAIDGKAPIVVPFPKETGQWLAVSQAFNLPSGGGVPSIAVIAENTNTDHPVLVDDLTFVPVDSAFEATSYDPRFWSVNGALGPNGESSRTTFDQFQQPILTSNATDALATIQTDYFSCAGNRGAFVPQDPNHSIVVRSAAAGPLTGFTRGEEWRRAWRGTPGVWQVTGTRLTQSEDGQAGSLVLQDGSAESSCCVAAMFTALEPVHKPAGIRCGTSLTAAWQPSSLQWELLDDHGKALAPPVPVRLFDVAVDPYAAQLDAGEISSGLIDLFCAAGYPLSGGATVGAGAAGAGSWTVTARDRRYRYDLLREGARIGVSRLGDHWVALVDARTFVLWVDGQRIFSHVAAAAIAGAPELFFGSRVAISQLAAALRPQGNVAFADPRGIVVQAQRLIDNRAIVSQTVVDDQGRGAVRTKAAYVTALQNPPLSYCADFARFDWQTGEMSGLITAAYPADQSYPFSRNQYEASPSSRIIAQGMPGEPFRIGAHATRTAYGSSEAALAGRAASYYRVIVTNPNGDAYQQFSNELGQILCKVSLRDGHEIRNVTLFDDAGNPSELRSPNYYDPPPGSAPANWTTRQTFDFAGRIRSVSTGDLGSTEYIYDRSGNLRFQRDPEGARKGHYSYWKYDRLNRVVETGYVTATWDQAALQRLADQVPDAPPTPQTWRKKYAYDNPDPSWHGIGRCWCIEVNNGDAGIADIIEGFTFDVAGNTVARTTRVIDAKQGGDNRVDYAYDNLGNITQITYPEVEGASRLDLHYRINATNQIAAIAETLDFAAPLATFTYLANGRPEADQVKLPAGAINRRYDFNSPLWATEISAHDAGGGMLFGERLSYTEGGYKDARYYDGTIASANYSYAGPQPDEYRFRYSYNSVGQIENAANDGQSAWDFGVTAPAAFDPNGNFSLAPQGGVSRQYNYQPGTQMVSSVVDQANGGVLTSCSYDGNGNALTMRTQAFATAALHDLTLSYDPATALTTRIVDAAPGGKTLDFRYGGFGQRVVKEVRLGATLAGRMVYIRGTNATPLFTILYPEGQAKPIVTRYIFGPGGMIAMRRDGNLYAILKDHLGSTRAVIDPAGSIVARYDYLTFGELASVAEPLAGFMPYLFTGHEFDREVGLFNFGARLYSGQLGRFISVDPVMQFFSPYVYAANDPVQYIDPSGRFSIGSLFSAIGGAIIGALEILAGVVVDIVAGVLEVITGGLSTPVSIALASLAGAFYGAGVSAISYSVFNFDNFSWKDYGIEMGIGALAGAITAGFGAAGAAAAESVTGVEAAIQAGQQVGRGAKAASALIEGGITVAGGAVAAVVSQTLNDVASGVTPGADLGTELGWSIVDGIAGALLPGASYKAGWGNLGARILGEVAKSELLSIGITEARNLAEGNPWDQGLLNAAFGALLYGSLGGLQVQAAAKEQTGQVARALAAPAI